MRARLSLVDRFFSTLVEEIREQEPSYLKAPFTVAEIYQTLVPYRTHRDRIGAELNGDYEDALLRLLAGEKDYLALESDTARERIRLELRSSNPNTGLYREYAAVGVRLNPERIPAATEGKKGSSKAGAAEGKAAGTEAGPTDDELDELVGKALDSARRAGADDDLRLDDLLGEALEDDEGDAAKEEAREGKAAEPGKALAKSRSASAGEAQPKAAKSVKSEGAAAGSGASAGSERVGVDAIPQHVNLDAVPDECPECSRALPSREGLRFCAFCGTNVFVVPCSSCGEVLERDWSFCVICGDAAG